MSALTPLQERFCNEYLVDLNATKAAARAGYSAGSNAGALMAHEGVLARIEQLQQERAAELDVTQKWVVENLKLVVERCMELEPVMKAGGGQEYEFDENGDLRPLVKFNANGATNALKLIGQHLGMFTEKVEHSGSVDTSVSDNELARRVAFLLQQAVKSRREANSSAVTVN